MMLPAGEEALGGAAEQPAGDAERGGRGPAGGAGAGAACGRGHLDETRRREQADLRPEGRLHDDQGE